MRHSAFFLPLSSSIALAAATLANAATPPHSADCAQSCAHEQTPATTARDGCVHTAAGAGVGQVQPVSYAPPPPGNKFPLPPPQTDQRAAQQRFGALAIRAVQGTPDGEPVGAVEVEVELYHRGILIDTIKATLDEHGVTLIEELPVAMGLQPLVKVFYSGVTYQKVGGIMDPSRPQQMLEVTCYQLTQEPPPWKLRMRHVVVALAPDGVQVTEVLAVHNPTQRTWVGREPGKSGDSEARAVTTQFLLPAAAEQVTLGDGFHDWCCSTLGENRIDNHLPLVPGGTEMIFAYFLPARKGQVEIEIASLADVEHLMVIVPDSLKTTSSSGLTASGADAIGDTPVRLYTAANLAGGSSARIVLAGLAGDDALAAGTLAKVVAAVGGGLILLFAVLILTRSPRKPGTAGTAAEHNSASSASLRPLREMEGPISRRGAEERSGRGEQAPAGLA